MFYIGSVYRNYKCSLLSNNYLQTSNCGANAEIFKPRRVKTQLIFFYLKKPTTRIQYYFHGSFQKNRGTVQTANSAVQELSSSSLTTFQRSTIPLPSMQIYTATHARLFPRILFPDSTCVSLCQEASKGVPTHETVWRHRKTWFQCARSFRHLRFNIVSRIHMENFTLVIEALDLQ